MIFLLKRKIFKWCFSNIDMDYLDGIDISLKSLMGRIPAWIQLEKQ